MLKIGYPLFEKNCSYYNMQKKFLAKVYNIANFLLLNF